MRRGRKQPRSVITVRDSTTSTATGSLVLAKPSVADGTLLIAVAATNVAQAVLNTGSLFTLNTQTASGLFTGGRFITSAASESATSYTFTGGIGNMSGTILALDGCDPTTPIIDIQRAFLSATANVMTPDITATEDGQTLLSALISIQTPTVTGVPAGMTSAYAYTGARGRYGAMALVQKALISGAYQWTNTSNNGGIAAIMLNPKTA